MVEGFPMTTEHTTQPYKPTAAFVGASWLALLTGIVAYLIGLYNAGMGWTARGFYFTVLLLGLFAVVSLQKAVRDRLEGVPVTPIYYGLSWLATGASMLLLTIGLWNADMARSEKGFYAMAFVLAMFAAVAVQKNVRDLATAGDDTSDANSRLSIRSGKELIAKSQ